MDMHAMLGTMMKPVLDQNIPFRVNSLCKLAGMRDMRQLPQCNNNCFRWMLGLCEGRDSNKSRCKVRPENNHPSARETPDDYAAQMVRLLQPGVDKLLEAQGAKRNRG